MSNFDNHFANINCLWENDISHSMNEVDYHFLLSNKFQTIFLMVLWPFTFVRHYLILIRHLNKGSNFKSLLAWVKSNECEEQFCKDIPIHHNKKNESQRILYWTEVQVTAQLLTDIFWKHLIRPYCEFLIRVIYFWEKSYVKHGPCVLAMQ